MADNSATFNLNVTSNGTTDKETKLAKNLNNELEKASKNSARVPKAVIAARQGVDNSRESGTARGIGGQTGAEGRDFAKQAAGLGGLVHVYATFAANLFAISAGFQALSKAADMSNMIKGLDQLGAASGRGLGTLAKQLSSITDGAIDMKQAMTSVAQATAGGMGSKDILRLGQVAKQASQALGRDMGDSIDRLTRGITKVQPELLDELGILTRADTAYNNYARSVGKSVTSLTDFEKHQAFANAVLDEGERKFGNIKLDANPYQKILASISNLTTSGLMLVNKVLTPILDLLAQSPTALTIAMAGLATVLLKQAMPAIGQWKQGLAAAAESAREAVIETNKLKKQKFVAGIDADVDKAAANVAKSLVASRKAIQDIDTAAGSGFLSKATVAFKSLKVGMTEGVFSDSQVAAITKRVSSLNKQVADSATTASASVIAAKKTEIEMYTKALKASEAAAAANKVQDEYINQNAKTGLAKFLDVQNLNQRLADKANAKSQSSTIVSNAANNATTFGVVDSLKKVYSDIKNAMAGRAADGTPFEEGVKGMTRLNAAITGVKATVAVTTAYITTLASAISNVFMVVGVFVTVFKLLDSYFSKNTKEVEKYTVALDSLSAATDTLSNTLEFIYKKKGIDVVSIDSTQAAATAVYELSAALESTVKAFEKVAGARSWWDKQWDDFWQVFNKGDINKLSNSVSGAIVQIINGIDDTKASQEYQSKLQGILGANVDLTSKNSIAKALNNKSQYEALSIVMDINKETAKTALLQANNASILTSYKTGLTDISKMITELNNQFLPQDISGKLGVSLISEADKIAAAIKLGPIQSLESLYALLQNPQVMSILPKDTTTQLIQAKTELELLNTELGKNIALKKENEAKLNLINDNPAQLSFGSTTGFIQSVQEVKKQKQDKELVTANISFAENAIKGVTTKITAATAAFKNIDKDVLAAGIEKLRISVKNSFEEAGIIAAKGYLSILKSAGGTTAESEAKLKTQEIGMQIRILESNFSQVKATQELNNTLAETNALEKIRSLEAKQASNPTSGRSQIDRDLEAANKELKAVQAKKIILETPTTTLARDFMGGKLDSSSKSKLTEETKTAIKDLQPFINAAVVHGAQVVKLQAQAGVAKSEEAIGARADKLKALKDANAITTANNALEVTSLDTQQSILGIYDKQISTRKTEISLDTIKNKYAEDLLAAENKLADIRLGASKQTDAGQKAKDKVDIANQELVIANLTKKSTIDTANLKAKDIYDQLMGIEAINAKYREMNASQLASINEIQLANVTVYDEQLNALSTLGQIDEVTLAKKKAINEQTRLDFDLQTQLLTIANNRAAAEAQYNAKKQAGAATPELTSQFNAQLNGFKLAEDAVKATNKAKSDGIAIGVKTAEVQAQINKLLADQQYKTEAITSFAESLAAAFGTVGTAIGGVLTSLDALAKRDVDYLIEKTKLEEQLKNAKGDPKVTADINDKIAQADKKYARDNLTNIASVAGATKKMFSEKTAAYKVMSATEKAVHVYKLAMDSKEILMDAFKTGQSVVNSLIRMASTEEETAVGAIAGIVNQAKGDPYTAFARMAAMAAFMAALTGKSKGTSVKGGFSAADNQKVTGTGQTYAGSTDNNPVNRAGGVLGDPTAISKAIEDSISLLSKELFGKVSPQVNAMVGYLKAIEDNTKQLAKSIISTGIFGTSPLGIKDASSSSGLGFNKSSTNIEDQGIKIVGSLDTLGQGLGQFDQYVNSITKSSSWWGLSSDSSANTTLQGLDKNIVKNISDIFKSVSGALVSAGTTLEGSGNRVAEVIKDFPIAIDASSKGLSATEFANKLISEIGINLNAAAEKAFPYMAQYVKIGEEYYTTVARIVKEGETLTKGLDMMGISIKTVNNTVEQTVAGQQNIISKFSGGIEEFVTSTQYYFDNFKTDTEKNKYYVDELSNSFKALHISTIPTKQGFIDLVQSLDLTNDSQATLYAGLLKLAPEMDKVAQITEKLRQDTLSQTIKNLQLEGKATEVLNLTRQEELANLDPLLKAQREYQFQLEDQIKLRKLDTELLTASGNTFAATLAQRQEELLTLTDAERVIKKLIYAQKDQSNILTAQLETLNALGLSYDALQIERMKQLQGLSEEEQLYKKRTFAAQDAAKTETLQLELMDAVGDTNGALVLRRKAELKGLSATDAALKTRIWLLQDEKKLLDQKLSQEVKIYELLGKSEEALRITRAQELAQLDPQLQANQLYIYALEDEATLKDKLKTAYDKESSSLKDTISKTKDFTKTLRDYRDSLLLGDNSILTPAQKYAEAKRQYLQTAAIATSLAVTDAQKAAQSDAVSKLPTVSDNFLQASKVLYASSDAYTNDFNSVLDILDKTSSYFDGAESDAQRTLDKLEEQKSIQQIIADNTESTTVLLQKYFEAQSATEAARVNAAVGGSNAAGGSFIAPTATATNASAYIDATGVGWIHGAAGFTGTFAEGQAIIVDALSKIDAGTMSASELISALIKQGITGSMLDTILGKSQGTSSAWAVAHGLPAFAAGGLASGMALVGENGPEVVDFKTPGRVYNNSQTNSMYGSNQELIKEIQSLRDEVKQLRAEQHEQTGHLIKSNYDANNIASDKISAAQAIAANSAEWNRRAAPKFA